VVDCWETANHQLSVVAFASGGAQLNYEWFKDGKSLSELYDANTPDENWANRAILYLDDMVPFRGFETGLSYDMQGVYHCAVTAGAAETMETEKVLVAVLRNPIISRQPESMQVALGSTIMMDAEAQIYGGIESSINLDEFEVIVQWYDASVAPPAEIVNDNRISGAKSTMLQIRLLTQEDLDKKYFVRMVGHCGTVVSEIAELTAMATVDFTVQPEDVVACEGDEIEVTFEAELTGGDGTEEIAYTLLKDGAPVEGPQSESMFPFTLTQDDEATYTVLAAVVPGDDTEMSEPFMVDVLSSATITSTMPAELAVDLADDSGTFTLEVVAEGDGEITYVWEFNDEVVGDAALYSIEAATFTTDDHAGTYRCTVTNECGTDAVEFTVTVVTGGIMMGVDNGTNAVQLSNTPNPVNVETKIEFNAETETSARLVVLDQSGREVAVLVDGPVSAGYNSVTMNVADYKLASGVYYYTLTINGTTTTNKLIVVK
ncbi:MAG: T9SS type A sorting domain-containing protein, partial [Chlorobi bacterium]|nr:T9SS type A sorting domain-containing protein [Chlorobiota bacterium]